MIIVQKLVATLLMLILLPLLILIGVLVFVTMGTPIFFSQKRTGLNGKIFKIAKFRTMTTKQGEDSARLTWFGSQLRRVSCDELPQIWNIVKGDMNFIGPRPLLPEYMPLYSDFQKRRNEVKPGVTGWAQINGRNAITWEQKFEFDVWYVDHKSFKLNCYILLRTIALVITGSGVSASNHATVEPFKGTKSDE
jgi:lipopolysaccharide/colanic/teichoic acid biosynthesis glycosyltransferase